MKTKRLNHKQSGRFPNLPYAGWVSTPNRKPHGGWIPVPDERSRIGVTPDNHSRRKQFHKALPALGVLLLANLACRPVLTIGWQEIGILVLLLALLLGPALFRLARGWEEFRAWKDKKDKEPPGD